MSSGGALPPAAAQLNGAFGHFSYLFPQPGHIPFNHIHAQQQQQRFKIKRQRQRVDAGEPRNNYQNKPAVRDTGSSSTLPHPLIFPPYGNPIATTEALNSLMPWISGNMEQQHQVKEEHTDSTTASLAANDQPTDLRCPKGKTEAHDSTKENVDDPEAEVALNVDNDEKEEKEIIEIRHNGIEKSVTPLSAESPSSSSSASKRKSYNPRKVDDTPEIRQADASDDAPAATESAGQEDNQPESKDEVEDGPQYSALQSQLNSMPNLKINNDMFETHKRFYSNLLEQQKKMMTTGEDRNRPAQQNSQQNIGQLAQSLKTEIVQNVSISIDKVLKEWAVAEAMQQLQTLEASRQMQNQLQQQQFPPVFPAPNPLASFGLPGAPPSGIFPNPFSAPAFNPLAVFNNLRRPPLEGEPKRKKEKPAEGITKQDDTTSIASESPSRSARESPKLSETPLSQYFPPTMVGHPMYGSGFCKDGSPPNSDDMSDFGDCTGGVR
ncbi:hypothetical protein WR25_18956 isoform D [Diploscapter pachys]|uniref:Uncharacterized protein n=1 Tax=Diploscapter pachys TaxID=2018661 RepID=A0A2A2M0J2_9BILA|nr:hypothetical protein WR25_18956 isoform B [Diploscapter pachys]PAV91794.1 hypothetical protein WR25_18956 isoform C [Diploscapter pachys]PAV91795.1 hypothetical protein WR25_18956 isoform D [Diploscapter pachys]